MKCFIGTTGSVLFGGLMLLGGGAANATTILYNDFSSVSGLTLNGAAAGLNTNSDNVLRLTNGLSQSASAFSTSAVALDSDASFSTAFSFRIPNPMGIFDGDGQGADGLTFTLQTVSNTAGGSGGGIGYNGLSNSVAVEFDTWNNGGWDDNDGNHVGIDLNGDIDSVAQAAVGTRMNNGQPWYAWIDYNGLADLLEVRLAETSARPGSSFLSYTVDLPTTLGSTLAYVGFTSGTGAAGGNHEILDWQFESKYAPIGGPAPVPVPAPLLLMAGGLLLLRRFNRKA